MHLFLIALLVSGLLVPVASRQPAVTRVAEGQNLQQAIDAARPGEVIVLARGARFTGNFVLPATPAGDAFITIRTEAEGLPGQGTRVTPQHAGTLARIQSATNAPALRTAAGAHHWRIENVEFGPTRGGNGAIIELGDETLPAANVPHHIVLDRVYVHGDPFAGQKRGIALNSASTEIRNSHVGDIKGVGLDTQAIAGWAGPGPYVIENNYLEAAGENVMFGGADPRIQGLVPRGITITGNVIARPAAWRDPILAAPAEVQALAAGGGTLAAGTYRYKVIAERSVAGGATAASEAGVVDAVRVGAAGAVSLQWRAVEGAAAYRVFREDGAGGRMSWPSREPRFTDTGAAGAARALPKPTVWTVKNLLELKNAADVVIDGNVFEHHWSGAQSGYAIVFTPRNQGGRAPWSRVENVRFTNNDVRHVSGGFNIVGVDNRQPSGPARNILIENNRFADMNGKTWGGQGNFLQMGDGAADVRIEGNVIDHSGRIVSVYGKVPSPGFVFRGNVARHNTYGVMGDNASPGAVTFQRYLPGAVFTDNRIAGGDARKYPGGNTFIAAGSLDSRLSELRRR